MLNPLLDNRVNAPESGILNPVARYEEKKEKKEMRFIVADRFRRVSVLLDRVGHRIR